MICFYNVVTTFKYAFSCLSCSSAVSSIIYRVSKVLKEHLTTRQVCKKSHSVVEQRPLLIIVDYNIK